MKLLTDEEIENQLVEMLCQRNGWDIPSPNDPRADYGDYDIAVEDVKWFIENYNQLAQHAKDEAEIADLKIENQMMSEECFGRVEEAEARVRKGVVDWFYKHYGDIFDNDDVEDQLRKWRL